MYTFVCVCVRAVLALALRRQAARIECAFNPRVGRAFDTRLVAGVLRSTGQSRGDAARAHFIASRRCALEQRLLII